MGFQQSLTPHKSLTTPLQPYWQSFALHRTMPICWSTGWAIFCGFVWESAAHPDGRLDRGCPGQFGLSPWTLPATFSQFSSLGSSPSSGRVWERGGRRRLSPSCYNCSLSPVAPRRIPSIWTVCSSAALFLVALFSRLTPKLLGAASGEFFYYLCLSVAFALRFSSTLLPYWPSGLSRANAIENSGFVHLFFQAWSRRWKCFLRVCAGSSAWTHSPLDSFPCSAVNWATRESKGFVILGWGLLFSFWTAGCGGD